MKPDLIDFAKNVSPASWNIITEKDPLKPGCLNVDVLQSEHLEDDHLGTTSIIMSPPDRRGDYVTITLDSELDYMDSIDTLIHELAHVGQGRHAQWTGKYWKNQHGKSFLWAFELFIKRTEKAYGAEYIKQSMKEYNYHKKTD